MSRCWVRVSGRWWSSAWNATGHRVPRAHLRGAVRRAGGAYSGRAGGGVRGVVLSYGEFDARVNRLARFLIGGGVGPESLVGVAVRRSVDLLVGMYAVVKAGGAYVPIDPDQPAERMGYVVATADPVVVLTTVADRVALPAEVCGRRARHGSMCRGCRVTRCGMGTGWGRCVPENPAYVIFTSGSTGRPKGVAVPHAGIVNRLLWMQGGTGSASDDVVLQKTPVTFDVSVWELFWPLQVGARLVIARAGRAPRPRVSRAGDPRRSRSPPCISCRRCSTCSWPGRHVDGCSSLRRVFTSGEALPPATAAVCTG